MYRDGQETERRLLAQTIDVVTVADLVERGDEAGMTDEIADALKTERISLRERPRDEHVRIFRCQLQRVFIRKVHVGLVQNDHALLRATERFQVGDSVAATRRRVRGGDESQGRSKVPRLLAAQLGDGGEPEIRREWKRSGRRAVNRRQHRVERITGCEELHRGVCRTGL